MSKRKLSKQQKSRIAANQAKKSSQSEHYQTAQSDGSTQQLGQICAHFGRSIELFDTQHQLHACALRQNLPPLVVGDWVSWQQLDNSDTGTVVALEPRTSLIGRQNKQGVVKPVAANISRLFIVTAALPQFKTELLDRYLINASFFEVEATIVFNKTDLLSKAERLAVDERLDYYEKLGYDVLFTSAAEQDGLSALKKALKDQTSVFVGQSGVGKSSLLNEILPDAQAAVGAISEKNTTGKHTTTTARLYYLAKEQGSIIDSPGIRDLLLDHLSQIDIAKGFIEFRPYLNTCHYSDCKHINEPHCAIKQAVADQEIGSFRYHHYKQLVASEPI